jgi:hypothetical protein
MFVQANQGCCFLISQGIPRGGSLERTSSVNKMEVEGFGMALGCVCHPESLFQSRLFSTSPDLNQSPVFNPQSL